MLQWCHQHQHLQTRITSTNIGYHSYSTPNTQSIPHTHHPASATTISIATITSATTIYTYIATTSITTIYISTISIITTTNNFIVTIPQPPPYTPTSTPLAPPPSPPHPTTPSSPPPTTYPCFHLDNVPPHYASSLI